MGLTLKNSRYLEFNKVFKEHTGEASKKSWAEYNRMKFIVYNNDNTQIEGSIHYYANNGEHNYDDFTYSRLKKTLLDIQQRFKLDLTRVKVINLEYGVNINPHIETRVILNGAFMHKRVRFQWMYTLTPSEYLQAPHKHFYVKLYNKALQNNITDRQILRFEIKFTRSHLIKEFGIIYLSDLLDKKNLISLGQHLTQVWEEVLFGDPTLERFNLPDKKWQQVLQWQNPFYWERLHNECKIKDKNKFERELKAFRTITNLQSWKIQDQILTMIKEKNDFLINH
jgi:hypothetical protein